MALVAAAAGSSIARAGPEGAVPAPDDAPSPAAVALVARKCSSCHTIPAAGGRSGWARASVSMHVRRVAMSRQEWALVREYLGDDSIGPDR